MTQEKIIQRATCTASAIEALVGLLQQEKTAPGGDAPRAEK